MNFADFLRFSSFLHYEVVARREIGENAAKAAEWRPDAAGQVDFL
jgi:hypothetical protein